MKSSIKAILVLLIITLGLVNTALRRRSHSKRYFEKEYREQCSKLCLASSTMYFCPEDAGYLCACSILVKTGFYHAKHSRDHESFKKLDYKSGNEAISKGYCKKI